MNFTQYRARCPWALDAAIALTLVVGYVVLLLASAGDQGYARDEGFYFQAAAAYEAWFSLLARDPAAALARENVDRYWAVNHEHPALMKSLFALSHRTFFTRWHWFAEPGTAYRFPGMVVSALALGVVFVWGRLTVGRLGGLVAALLLGFMPHVFYHSHLDCFDMPVASMWLITTFVFWLSVHRRHFGWAILTGVLYGLLLNTKHNAWLLPFALVLHVVLTRGGRLASDALAGRITLPLALVAMAVLGPLVFYATWPWIWFDTMERLAGWFEFHLHHEYYNMEFLGNTYWKPPMPRLYAPVMTVATVPAITLLLSALGIGIVAVNTIRSRLAALPWGSHRELVVSSALPAPRDADAAASSDTPCPALPASRDTEAAASGTSCAAPLPASRGTDSSEKSSAVGTLAGLDPQRLEPQPVLPQCVDDGRAFEETALLWGLCLALSYAPWLSTDTPIFGGTKHWLTAYPFLCLFAGLGFSVTRAHLQALAARFTGATLTHVVPYALAALVLTGPLKMTYDSHPWGLGFYTPLVGGAPGAATLGLNRSFWGYTTGAVIPYLNAHVPPNGVVYVHDTALQSWAMLVADGRLRPDIRATLNVAEADLALYHHEQHMSRVEHQAWVVYGTVAPLHIGTYHGVPVVWIYGRPKAGD